MKERIFLLASITHFFIQSLVIIYPIEDKQIKDSLYCILTFSLFCFIYILSTRSIK